MTRSVGELKYEASALLDTPHGFSTRRGGVSEGHLASLNLRLHSEDDPRRLRENYRRFCAAIGADVGRVVMANQVHGTAVRRVTGADCKADLLDETPVEADGLVTDEAGITLFVFSADCVPILLFDPVRRVVAACHAGWRGTAGAIAGETVGVMAAEYACRREDIRAAIGPAIGPCCFETDGDVPEAMTARLGRLAEGHMTRTGEKYHVDLKAINREILLAAGLTAEHVDRSDVCTCCEHETYWSHRHTQGRRGVQCGAIMLEERL